MNWITRYVQAVVDRLPKKDQKDVSEELTSLLEEEAEARFSKEIEDIPEEDLKKWIEERDHPSIAAVAYQSNQTLIAESAYPLYWSAVKIMAIITGVLIVLSHLSVLFSSGHINIWATAFGATYAYLRNFLVGYAIITLVFHFGSKQLNAREWYKNWDAERLPNTNHKWKRIPYSNSIFNIIFSFVFLAWLMGWTEPTINLQKGAIQTLQPEHLAPEIVSYFPWFYVFAIVSILNSIDALFRPYWRYATLAVAGLLSLAIGSVLLDISFIPEIVDWNQLIVLENQHTTNLISHLDNVVTTAIRIAAAISFFDFGRCVYRIVRFK